jgi:DNA-binding LytR/AlgR family response regulator
MVKIGSSLGYLKVSDIAYFYSDQSLVFARKPDGKKYNLDTTLDQVMTEVDPAHFFRISRKILIHLNSIGKIDTYFNGRLLLQLVPAPDFQTTVSRDRVNDFKAWLDR